MVSFQYKFGDFIFDPGSKNLFSKDFKRHPITPRAAQILEMFLSRPGDTISIKEINKNLSIYYIISDNWATVMVSHLRKVLHQDYILTRRKGYSFNVSVEKIFSPVESLENILPEEADAGAPKPLRVFLCHSSDDKMMVRDLFTKLNNEKDFVPWLDEENLLPGQDFELEIRKAIRNSDAVLVCLSQNSINKKGFVQKEIKFALDIADEMPEGAVFLIPVRLEDCEVPERLARLHWVNLFHEMGFENLCKGLKSILG